MTWTPLCRFTNTNRNPLLCQWIRTRSRGGMRDGRPALRGGIVTSATFAFLARIATSANQSRLCADRNGLRGRLRYSPGPSSFTSAAARTGTSIESSELATSDRPGSKVRLGATWAKSERHSDQGYHWSVSAVDATASSSSITLRRARSSEAPTIPAGMRHSAVRTV